MAWTEFHATRIKRLKKFSDFRKAVNWSVHEALGFLGDWWGQTLEVCEDGDVTGWTPDYLAELTGLGTQVSPKVWEALVTCGWIDKDADGKLLVHDWPDWAGRFLRARHGDNKARLTVIWALHGRTYGAGKTPDKLPADSRHTGDTIIPFPSPPLPTTPGPGGEGEDHQAKQVLEHLNQKAGKGFKPVESNLRPVRARLGEGHTIDDLKRVVDVKVAQWGKDAKMAVYLRPETLFGATKFQGYANERPPHASTVSGIPAAEAQLQRLGL